MPVYLSTMPRSGTWYLHYFFELLDALLTEREMIETDQHFGKYSGLGVFKFQSHSIFPGFCDEYFGRWRENWDLLEFGIKGYNYGHSIAEPYSDVIFPKRNKNARVIYVYRNPLDQMVSAYGHILGRLDPEVRNFSELSSDGVPASFSEYVRLVGIESYLKQYLSFHLLADRYPENLKMVRYEDIVENPVRSFSGMLEFCGFNIDTGPKRNAFDTTLELTRIENMRRLETSLGLPLAQDRRNPRGSHIQSGVVGRWRVMFDDDSLELVKSRFDEFGIDVGDFTVSSTSRNESSKSDNSKKIAAQYWAKAKNLKGRRKRDALSLYVRAVTLNPELSEALSEIFRFNPRLQNAALNNPDVPVEYQNLAKRGQAWSAVCDGLGNFEENWQNLKFPVDHLNLLTHLTYSSLRDDIYSELIKRTALAYGVKAGKSDPIAHALMLPSSSGRKRIRISVLSTNFIPDHYVWLSYKNLFKFFDKDRFEIYLYLANKESESLVPKLEDMAIKVVKCWDWSDYKLSESMRRDGIVISVDINGFHPGSRPMIYALRSAPLQVLLHSYGRPVHSPFHDYQFTDRVLIPKAESDHEKLIWVPQPCTAPWSLEEFELSGVIDVLPEIPFRIVAPHNGQKITDDAIRLWFSIVREIPGAILSVKQESHEYIAAMARHHELPNSVIAFPRHELRGDYLRELSTYHLALDTVPFSASATGVDCIAACLPMLTLSLGNHMGRMASNILSSSGYSELIATDAKSFQAKAVGLAKDRASIIAWRRKLIKDRSRNPIFDPVRMVRNIERGLLAIHSRWAAGLAPEHFAIPALADDPDE